MEKTIQKPIIIGNFLNDGGEMAWAWWLEEHSRLAIIGDNSLSPKHDMVKELARLVHEHDKKAVFWITGEEEVPATAQDMDITAIEWVEKFPDPPEIFSDRQDFINNRNFFSSSYLQLLAKVKGVNRKDLLPPASFRAHVEGPLMGYQRVVESMEDGENKEWIKARLNELSHVVWKATEEHGAMFTLPKEKTLYERALAFLQAVWSYWAYLGSLDNPQQLLMIVELPKEFVYKEAPEDVQRIVVEALRILNYLTVVTTTTLVLSSETLYPAAEQNFRYRLFFQTQDSDIAIESNEIKEALQMPELYGAWELGFSHVGMWEDSHSMVRYVSEFRRSGTSFMDDFGEEPTDMPVEEAAQIETANGQGEKQEELA
ncbi:hypothetical protein [Aneurinibacillus tyrosinisolvens]|uniref:hypothetical protein n=1 Tax=Aneurinibacillus tyrosinisolvens TaxID=1443435 RepID=UPI00063EE9BF|nr:hypothetical protein [Aneurinibacillus tyrosinisolvens]